MDFKRADLSLEVRYVPCARSIPQGIKPLPSNYTSNLSHSVNYHATVNLNTAIRRVTLDRVGNESNIFTGSEPRPSFSEIDRSRVVIIEGKTRDTG